MLGKSAHVPRAHPEATQEAAPKPATDLLRGSEQSERHDAVLPLLPCTRLALPNLVESSREQSRRRIHVACHYSSCESVRLGSRLGSQKIEFICRLGSHKMSSEGEEAGPSSPAVLPHCAARLSACDSRKKVYTNSRVCTSTPASPECCGVTRPGGELSPDGRKP